MTATILTAFRSDTAIEEHADGSIAIRNSHQSYILKKGTPGLRHAIHHLATTNATEQQLSHWIRTHDGVSGLAIWKYHQHQLRIRHFLSYILEIRNKPVATLLSAPAEFASVPPRLPSTETYLLSRFALARRDPQYSGMLIESPLSAVRIILHEAHGVALLGGLSQPQTVQELVNLTPGDSETTEILLSLLAATGMIVSTDSTDSDENATEEGHAALPYWEFHDLLFHSRSRMGRHDTPIGGTYRFGMDNPPCPVVKANLSNDIVDLKRPDIDQLMEHDLPFTRVLETRRSTRQFDHGSPIHLHQLGEFLYRVARLRQIIPASTGVPQELSDRPYPSGGALHELVIYLIVHRCDGLSSGFYQYNPLQHQLCKITEENHKSDQLLQESRRAYGGSADADLPQVLLLVTSRIPRVSWKYESMAYATTLKNTGVLYQTMYLVATAMGLAGSALGCGNSDLFVEATGIDYYEESLVGEFVLGTPRAVTNITR